MKVYHVAMTPTSMKHDTAKAMGGATHEQNLTIHHQHAQNALSRIKGISFSLCYLDGKYMTEGRHGTALHILSSIVVKQHQFHPFHDHYHHCHRDIYPR
jgi:hypothetical protein